MTSWTTGPNPTGGTKLAYTPLKLAGPVSLIANAPLTETVRVYAAIIF